MTVMHSSPLSVVFWPVVALWKLLTFVLELAGRLVLAAVALVIMIAGAILTVTVAGAVVGIPLIVLGVLLLIRGIF
ncbi:MAG TPA: hypothetical protein VJ417_04145 [Candidatus Glassbacteria bacterium]|nr:hypothetical protein [Candidatus Glassbacteria bacterium]